MSFNFFVHAYGFKGICTSVSVQIPSFVPYVEAEEAYTIPIGEAKIMEEGSDVTLISYGPMIQTALEAIEIVKKEGNV